jgi:hypothetical protein
MKIINISVDIESQLLNSRSTSSQKNKPNENVSEQQKETKTPQKKARKTKGTQSEKLRPDTDRISEVPIEYKLLMEVSDFLKIHAPSPELIEAISYASDDIFFKKAKFWRCLMDYKKYGLRPPYSIHTNANKELYYIHIRFKKYLI